MWKVSTDRDVNTAVNHTTNLLRKGISCLHPLT